MKSSPGSLSAGYFFALKQRSHPRSPVLIGDPFNCLLEIVTCRIVRTVAHFPTSITSQAELQAILLVVSF